MTFAANLDSSTCSGDEIRPMPKLYRKTGYNPGRVDCNLIEQLVVKVRGTLTTLLKKRKYSRDNLGYIARKCLKNLMMTKNIIIKKADKGSGIVVENTTEYVQNGQGHLTDKSVYKRVDRDISMPIKSPIVRKLELLHQTGKLNEEQYKYCLPLAEPKPARLYILKKVALHQ